ncbi:protein of unknown function [Burkholderia multivorans]
MNSQLPASHATTRHHGSPQSLCDGVARIVALPVLLITLATTSGCGTINVRAGNRPNVAALDVVLKPGESTEQNVQNALGVPAGRGRSLMPWQSSPRTVWTYYYEEGQIAIGGDSDDRRIFLFVFFDKDRYDGYLWFSSLKQ